MKTIKILALAMLACLFSNSIKAQSCNFYVSNAAACDIGVTINYYTNCSTSPTICKTINATVLAGTISHFNCMPGCSAGPCDIQVTVNWIHTNSASNTVTGATVSSGSTTATGSFTTPCDGSTSMNVVYDNGLGVAVDLN